MLNSQRHHSVDAFNQRHNLSSLSEPSSFAEPDQVVELENREHCFSNIAITKYSEVNNNGGRSGTGSGTGNGTNSGSGGGGIIGSGGRASGTGSTESERGSTGSGYFIFDDLTLALQDHQQQLTDEQMQSQQSPHQNVATQGRQLIHQQKSRFGDGESTYHFKTLVPSVAAGAIIGKGGETIATIQRDTGARVKMSKSHDFYPGTSERVCLISGSVEAILSVLDFIMEKIREKPDLNSLNKSISSDMDLKQPQERDKQVKILVPNSTAGMIIGKAGAYIKQIKEESGSYVQISQKPKDITLQERCITIIGERENNKAACQLILAKIMEDPQSSTCLNVSYADVNGPVANFNPTGSPYATSQGTIASSTASLNTAVTGPGLIVNGTGINLSLNLGPTNNSNPAVTAQIVEHIKLTMRGSGYSEQATNEVSSALAVLAKYGVLGIGLTAHPHTNGAHPAAPLGYLGVSPLEQAVNASNMFGAIGQVNMESFVRAASPTPRPPQMERYDASAFDPFRHNTTATPISINNNTFGLASAAAGATAQAIGAVAAAAAAHQMGLSKSPTPGDVSIKDTKNVEIPEIIVGAILGPSGRSLVEIQQLSGATVQISKKGSFAPGTRNRIVTITGPSTAIHIAHILIEQKINEEETKRRQNNMLQ